VPPPPVADLGLILDGRALYKRRNLLNAIGRFRPVARASWPTSKFPIYDAQTMRPSLKLGRA